MTESKRIEFNKKLNPDNPWVCPKCGSHHTICHAGMYVDRFECLDCHWGWR